ncbi:MAG: T9SS type A sorting domain-containing protein [Cryomorphaceae bacterium]|nr:T9SS type A sorting domain-containing protein [Cryomorphaceae bacterium]
MKHSTSAALSSFVRCTWTSVTDYATVGLVTIALLMSTFVFGQGSVPSNDLCSGALPILCGEQLDGTTEFANSDGLEFCGNTPFDQVAGEPGVWFKHAGTNAFVTLTLDEADSQDNFDTFVGVYTGSCNDLVCLTGDDDSGVGLNSSVTFLGESGVEYFLYVTGWDPDGEADGDNGPFNFSLSCVPACSPEITISCPADVTVECGTDISPESLNLLPLIDSNDCVGDLTITFMDDQISNNSCPLVIARTWIATDGETTEMCTQTITVQDTQAPVFTAFPEDMTIECFGGGLEEVLSYLDDNDVQFPEFTDNCGAELIYEPFLITEGLECPVVAICGKQFTVVDACGNSVERLFTVTITDYTGPEFSAFDAEVLVSCLEDVPGPESLTATDACSGSEFEVETFESNTGELINSCDLSTAFGPGDDWALWLPSLYDAGITSSANFLFDANGGHFDQFIDGTAHMYGTIVNDVNPNESFVVDFWFENAADWATWSGLGRNVKDDLGCAADGNLFETYTYYEMVNGFSTMTGAGDLAGSSLSFYHMPDSYYFGLQIGLGANNKNCGYGLSAWFTYDGFINGEWIEGHGDVNADASCEPNFNTDCANNTEFTYIYRAVDACGNPSIAFQTIIVNDEIAPEFVDFPADITVDCQNYPVEIPEVSAVDNCIGEVTIIYLGETTAAGECANEFVVTHSWAAFDICDNRADISWNVNVVDNEAPVMEGLPAAEVTAECDAVPAAPEVTATDNCSLVDAIELSFEENIQEGNCVGNYTIIRVWSATDECGNTSDFTQVINVQDTTAPTFDAYVYYTAIPCEDVDAYTLTASDNCGSASVEIIEEVLQSGGCMGVLYRVYEATDECGNVSSVEQYITITDTTAPSLVNVPEDMTVECSDVSMNDDGYFFSAGDVYGVDNCANEVTITYSESVQEDGDDCPQSYIIVRTWVATDYCEHETTDEQIVTVIDTTSPEFVEFPGDLIVECSDEFPAVVYPIGVDNCDESVEIVLTEEIEDGDCPAEYILRRIFRGFDDCGNEVMGVQTINFVDTQAPFFTAVPDAMTIECNTDIPASEAFASDLCSDVTVSYSDAYADNGSCPQEYYMLRTFVAIDACGNSAEATQLIHIVDTTAPIFDAYEVSISMPCDNIEVLLLTATDNCGNVEVSYNDTQVSGGCAGHIIRDFVAVDECGNEAYAQQVIILVDEVAPVITAGPADMVIECDQEVPGCNVELISYEDNCTEVEVSCADVVAAGDCPQEYTITRTYTAEDNCGNTSTYVQTISVVDTTAPYFEFVAQSVTIECDQDVPAPAAEVGDNCGDATWTVSGVTTPGECDSEYVMVRTYTATDACGNTSTEEQVITVVDTTAPEFTFVPGPVTLECDQEMPAPSATATDNCSEPVVSHVDVVVPGQCANEYTVVRTYTATDACGNVATAEQSVSFIDTTAPVFDAYTIFNQIQCDEALDFPMLTATDNCGEVTVTCIYTPVSGGCAGNIIRDCVATDACGNTTTAQQIFQLVDNTAPVFVSGPADMIIECGNDVPGCDVESVVVEDNCTAFEVTCADVVVAGDCPAEYTITRTYTAIDNCMNMSTYVQTISVVDTTMPWIEYVGADATIECDQAIPAAEALVGDNCGDATWTSADAIIAGECANEYTLLRTYTATDECGNTNSAVQTIYVVDTTAPYFVSVAPSVTIECDQDMPVPAAEVADNCGDATWTVSGVITPGQCANEYVMVRTYTATDACGNTATTEQVITVVDTTAPFFISVEPSVTIECDEDMPAPAAEVGDNCGDATWTVSGVTTPGECANEYVMVRTYVASDACGNTTSATQTITVIDTTAPIFSFVAPSVTIQCDQELPAPAAQVTDNCGDATWTVSGVTTPGACANEYVMVRTYVAVDACGNMTEATQTITVVDTVAPEFMEYGDSVTIECTMEIPAPYSYVIDNCDELVDVVVTDVTAAGDCPQEYTITRTYTATDDCGNSSSVQQVITVVDTTAPMFTSVPQNNEISCDANLPTEEATATDNCGIVTVMSSDQIIPGQCANAYTVVRTWVATDECGNSSEAETMYYVYDNQAPVFTTVLTDVVAECADEVPAAPEVAATDNCGEVLISMTSSIEFDDCGNYYAVYTYYAEDACGNQADPIFYTVTVLDETAPVFDQELEANVVLDCTEEVPAAPVCTATDNCAGEVEVSYEEVLLGDLPAEGSIADCLALTPAAYEDGETCNGLDPWSLILFSFDDADAVLYSSLEVNFVQYPDGSATLTGSVVRNDDPSRGWDISVNFANGMDWASWSTQAFPTGYKDDCNLSGDNHLDWTYYIMQAGATLTGWGANAGSTLNLAHAPSNLYYGYQVGVAANNVNVDYGSGGWFTYSGLYQGNSVSGAGDFAFDHDCCPRYSIERTWCASDCTGNETCFTQTISFEDLGLTPPAVGGDFQEVTVAKGEDFVLTKVQPNPAYDNTMIEFYSDKNNTVVLEVLDMSGRRVATLYEGTVIKGQTYRNTLNAALMQSGVYTVRLSSLTQSAHAKLIVTR